MEKDPTRFLWRGYSCRDCKKCIRDESKAVELVSKSDENDVIGPFCNGACADSFLSAKAA